MIKKRHVQLPGTAGAHDMQPGQRRPEALVGFGFRYWLAGFRTGDVGCWELAWNVYASELGAQRAKPVITELSCWVRSIHQGAARGIEISPASCPWFCRDECLAISMVAACLHSACPALRSCAFALLGTSNVDAVVEGAEQFAQHLTDADQVLHVQSIRNAAAVVGNRKPRPH